MPPRRVSNLEGANNTEENLNGNDYNVNLEQPPSTPPPPPPQPPQPPPPQQQQPDLNSEHSENDVKPTEWDDSFETICSNLIDEAQINTYLHLKSHRYYSKWSRIFQIPIILLSAVVGSANFASDNFGSQKEHVILAVGGVSICNIYYFINSSIFKISRIKRRPSYFFISLGKVF